MSLFQSTLPRRERLSSTFHGHYHLYFNPRSREGSDGCRRGKRVPVRRISIHAPAKGATMGGFKFLGNNGFQSTLPRRERQDQPPAGCGWRDFNPRSREGSDDITNKTIADALQFQSTLPRRERHSPRWCKKRGKRFQSTLPRRERLSSRSYVV